jgi:hypothetical protein
LGLERKIKLPYIKHQNKDFEENKYIQKLKRYNQITVDSWKIPVLYLRGCTHKCGNHVGATLYHDLPHALPI